MRTVVFLLGLLSGGAVSAANYTGTGTEFAGFAAAFERSRSQGAIYGGAEVAMNVSYYQGFVSGAALSTREKAWCPRGAFTMGQISSVVAKFLADNPELWNRTPAELVALALGRAFPCAQDRKK